ILARITLVDLGPTWILDAAFSRRLKSRPQYQDNRCSFPLRSGTTALTIAPNASKDVTLRLNHERLCANSRNTLSFCCLYLIVLMDSLRCILTFADGLVAM